MVAHDSLTSSKFSYGSDRVLPFLTTLAKVLSLVYRVNVWILAPAVVSVAMFKRFSTLLGPMSTLELVGRFRATYTIIT